MKKISLTVAMILLVLGFAFTVVPIPQAHAQSYFRSTTTSLSKISKATQPNLDRCGGGAWVESFFEPDECVYTQQQFSAVINICSDPGVRTWFVYLDANTGKKQQASIASDTCQHFGPVAGTVFAIPAPSACIKVNNRNTYISLISPRC